LFQVNQIISMTLCCSVLALLYVSYRLFIQHMQFIFPSV